MATSYVAVGTAMHMITVSRCPAKKNPAANDPRPPRRVLSGRHLRRAQACGMLRSSGRSSVEGGGFLEIDLATQEALRSLGERVRHFDPRGSLVQSADPGRTAAHHRSQHPSPSCAVLTPQARPGLAGARSRLRGHLGVAQPEIVLCGLLRAPGGSSVTTTRRLLLLLQTYHKAILVAGPQ